ncbi:MAG TPA: long-chain fatty acid--CoA ligase [Thermoleophilaceae bacterium]
MQSASTGLSTSAVAETAAVAAPLAAERHGDTTAVRYKRGDDWGTATFTEVGRIVDEVALGLIASGIEPGDRVCILAETRVDWTYASLAVSSAGCVVVPVYPTNSPEECRWVVGNSGAKAIFCEDAGQLEKIMAVRDALTELETIVSMEPADGAMPVSELRERGSSHGDPAELERRREGVSPDDPCTIIYTSGTTGPPKGTVLTHANCASVGAICEELGFVSDDDVAYLYLPLAHVFALQVQLAAPERGAEIIYFGGNTRAIVPELAETKPTYFPSVPRIFEKVYGFANAQLENASEEERAGFRAAIEVGVKVHDLERAGEPVPDELRAPFEAADEQIFKNVRAIFGGRLRQAVSGAAPIADEILEFFYACGVLVLEGWGLTETTGLGAVNTREHLRIGTVGRPVPGAEIRIADDGEILMRGPHVFKEYWRNPEATREAFTEDGWFMTGDLGALDDDGYLSITGRKKDIIITAGGKNLTPANLENDLKQSRWISQAVMYGDRRPYPVAMITLDPEEILPWAKEHGRPEDLAALAEDDEVREMIEAELERANRKYARVEQVKRFAILDRDLSQDEGELTPTLKVKRNVVYDRHRDFFESLYARE